VVLLYDNITCYGFSFFLNVNLMFVSEREACAHKKFQKLLHVAVIHT